MGGSDIVIIGGGPAGLAAAIAARLRGFTVTVADASCVPIDKACGEGIMPDGVEALRGLGVEIERAESFPFRGVRFIDGKLAADAAFAGSPGLGVRRDVLHRELAGRASELGVAIRWASPIRTLSAAGVQIGDRIVPCRWIIGADGQNSRVRRWAGLTTVWSSRPRVGVRRHFRVRPWADCVEVYWQQTCEAYVTPVAADQVCVALLGNGSLRMTDLPLLFPELARRIKDAQPTNSIRGGLSVSTRLRSVVGSRLALIGDASGSVDAITGDGLSMAFRQAVALGDAIDRNDLSLYQAAHERITRIPRLMARLMLAMERHAPVRHAAMRLLAARPNLFSRLLMIRAGALTLATLQGATE